VFRCSTVNPDSVIAVQVFDQKKFKRKGQGFLGVINITIGSDFVLAPGKTGTPRPALVRRIADLTAPPPPEEFQLELKKSASSRDAVTGTLTVILSTETVAASRL
jgi:E3 ubiquitin-protein ligase NEDD4